MPRVKIDYVVSFSSEDPEHPASNLLLWEVSKKKWLCKKGDTSCSVVLQLPRSVKITGVHIGAYHAALVEVLVGRSEMSSEQFQVLVPSSVFVSRSESRRDAPALRVRSFGAAALSAHARDQRWDRVRLVCSQPHNKHAQFGLSFVHVDEAESGEPARPPARPLALAALSSDEDDFKPGELFAKHRQSSGETHTSMSANTGAQIRQATSQALKNIAESSTKLTKTPISKPPTRREHSPSSSRSSRARDELLYSRHDLAPHARIDRVLARHQHHTTDNNDTHRKTKDDAKINTDVTKKHESQIKNELKTKREHKETHRKNNSESPPRSPRIPDKPSADNKVAGKRCASPDPPATQAGGPLGSGSEPGPVSAAPHTLLSGAALVLSGYENPRRAQVRDLALALGARVLRDWGPDATHLICAFPRTPKLRAVRALDGAVPAARAAWLRHMARRRRVLPWRWFATEPQHHVPPPHGHDARSATDTRDAHDDPDSGDDTDDEIEKVLQAQKKQRLDDSGTSDDARTRGVSPAANKRDASTRGASTRGASPDASTHGASPAANKRDASPHASTRGASPDASTRGASPDASTRGASPDASTRGASPDASTRGASPDASTRGASPDASTRGASPDASTRGASPDASTRGASPDASTRGASPDASTRGASPDASTRGASPDASTRGASPDASTRGASPDASTRGASPDASTRGASPDASTRGASPDASTRGASPDASTRGASPDASTRGASPDASTSSEEGGSTDDSSRGPRARAGGRGALPDFFEGLTFAIAAAPPDATHLARYVRAYGGVVLPMSQVAVGSEVDYVVRGRGGEVDTTHARVVSAAWLARCHDARALLPHDHTLTNVS